MIFETSQDLPETEKYNLISQIRRASTSIALNIAEGSTGLSNAEQIRFLGHSLRSYLETIACLDIIGRREYLPENDLRKIRQYGHQLFIRLAAFRNSLQD